MAELKTKKSNAGVAAFLNSVDNEQRHKDSPQLLAIFNEVTKMQPGLWGSSVAGFGEFHYKSERSSQEGDWPLTGFSPRKRNMTVYIMPGFSNYRDLMNRLGKHKSSVSCIYFSKLADIDVAVLKQIVRKSVSGMKKIHAWKS